VTVHLIDQNVKIIINTRNPIEHEGDYVWQVQESDGYMMNLPTSALNSASTQLNF
jgi:hypothetical protein